MEPTSPPDGDLLAVLHQSDNDHIAQTMPQRSPLRVLVADDVPNLLRLMEMVLADWGYEVVACEDGQQAWETLQQPDAPRLAILDWMMPGLQGIEVCKLLRERT